MLLPTGYWTTPETFRPLQFTFSYKEGKLHLTQMATGTQSGIDHILPSNINFKDLGSLIGTLMLLSTKPSVLPSEPSNGDQFTLELIESFQGGSEKVSVKVQLLKLFFPGFFKKPEESKSPTDAVAEKAKKSETPSNFFVDETRMKEFVAQLALAFGGEKVTVADTQPRERASQDPWYLLHQTLRLQFPETPLSDKILFTFSLLSDRLTQVLSGIPEMTQLEREQWTFKLKSDWDELNKQLQKEYDDPDVLHTLLGGGGNPFAVIGERLAELHTTVAKLSKQAEERHALNFERTFLSSLGGTFAASRGGIIKTADQVADKSPKLAPSKIGKTDIENVKALKGSWNSDASIPVEATLDDFEKISTRLNELVESKDYADALRLYRMAMEELPPPNSEHPFWKRLSRVESSQPFERFNRALDNMTHFFWEAKLKRSESEQTPEEYVDMMCTEAAMLYALGVRGDWVAKNLDKIGIDSRAFDSMSIPRIAKDPQKWSYPNIDWVKIRENKISFEDISCLVNLRCIDCYGYFARHLYERYLIYSYGNYFRPGVSNALSERLKNLEQFARAPYRTNLASAKLTLDQVNRLFWHAYHDSDGRGQLTQIDWDTRDKKENDRRSIQKSQLTFGSKTGPHFSNQFVSLFRHNYFFGSFPLDFSLVTKDKGNARLNEKERRRLINQGRLDIRYTDGGHYWEISEGISHRLADCELIVRGSSASLNVMLWDWGGFDIYRFSDAVGVEKSSNAYFCTTPKAIMFARTLDVTLPGKTANWGMGPRERTCGTEGTFLSQELHRSSKPPVDVWEIDKLETRHKDVYAWQNVEAVFDYAIKRPDTLDEPDVRRRLFLVCTRPGLIEKLKKENPDYLETHIPLIREVIERLKSTNSLDSASFLMWLTSFVEPQDLSGQLTKWIEDEKIQWEQRVDMAAYLLHNASGRPVPNNPEYIAQLLSAASQLQVASASCTMPGLAKEGVSWVEEKISLWLRDQSKSFQNRVFDLWVELCGGPSKGTEWTYSEKDNLWVSADRTKKLDLDHLAMEVPFKQKRIASRLSRQIVREPLYQRLFGGDRQFTANVVPGKESGSLVYEFSDEQNNQYRLTHEQTTNAIVIERLFEPKMSGEKTAGWYQLTMPDVQDARAFDQTLTERGFWINVQEPAKGLTFLRNDIVIAESKDVVRVAFDRLGRVQECLTHDGYQIAPDPDGRLTALLNPTGEKNILFLRKKGASGVSKIQLCDQGITLEKEGKEWIVTEGIYKGCHWIVGAKRTPLASYGVNVEQFGISLCRTNQTGGRTC